VNVTKNIKIQNLLLSDVFFQAPNAPKPISARAPRWGSFTTGWGRDTHPHTIPLSTTSASRYRIRAYGTSVLSPTNKVLDSID